MMVYRRKGRPGFSFMGRTPTGWKQLGTGARRRALAAQIEAMWHELAEERAWDVLGLVLERPPKLAMARLYDLWVQAERRLTRLRRILADRDVEPLVAPWHEEHARGVTPDSAAHALTHVRWLLPAGVPRVASSIAPAWLSERLAAYPGKRNTLRKVHSSWSVFFDYATRLHRLWDVSPMLTVERPQVERPPIRFLEWAQVAKLVAGLPAGELRTLVALLYGSGLELSTALALRRADFRETEHGLEVRGAGTKTLHRDRVALVSPWATAYLRPALAALLPEARVFPGLDRWRASKQHRAALTELGLPAYRLHNARHHWAVMRLREGVPVAVVSRQLGHGSATLTLSTYGRFIPTGADSAKWEGVVEQARQRDEREAKKRAGNAGGSEA